jgi:lipopolysaccharide export LptBFGC system permease protein LptF
LVSKSEINPNIGAWLPNFLFLFVTLYIIKVVRK